MALGSCAKSSTEYLRGFLCRSPGFSLCAAFSSGVVCSLKSSDLGLHRLLPVSSVQWVLQLSPQFPHLVPWHGNSQGGKLGQLEAVILFSLFFCLLEIFVLMSNDLKIIVYSTLLYFFCFRLDSESSCLLLHLGWKRRLNFFLIVSYTSIPSSKH